VQKIPFTANAEIHSLFVRREAKLVRGVIGNILSLSQQYNIFQTIPGSGLLLEPAKLLFDGVNYYLKMYNCWLYRGS
jgi:hypothetical protein